MPELPEVETTRRGISQPLVGQPIRDIIIRQPKLRWPVPEALCSLLPQQHLRAVERRGKYLLLRVDHGTLLIHLGMSGCLRVLDAATPVKKHDHVDIVFANNLCLRFNDPRRFGCILWTADDPLEHVLLKSLGPEPLSDAFNSTDLFQCSRGRKVNIKQFIMNGRVVVGVGNIYANEALFMAGISPLAIAGKISKQRYTRLVDCIKDILEKAIAVGGTTLKDFYQSDGQPGYFVQQLQVYGRGGEDCVSCGKALKEVVIGQRASVYCSHCQR